MKPHFWSPSDDRRLFELIAAGHTNREIGALLGRSTSGVKMRRNHLKAPRRPTQPRQSAAARPRTPMRRDTVAALVAAIDAEGTPAIKRLLRLRLIRALWHRRKQKA